MPDPFLFQLLQWSTDSEGRGVALINGQAFTHEQVCRLRDELAEVAAIGRTAPSAGVQGDGVRERDFDAGWRTAANWMHRDDLLADMDSPAYLSDRAAAIAGQTPGEAE